MEVYLGQVIVWPGSWIPKGFAACDGRLLPINQHQALFSLLGTTYGGDGKSTFALPNLAPVVSRKPKGEGFGITERDAAGFDRVGIDKGSQPGARYLIAMYGEYPPHP
ncbi:tail fiber protein [Massilia sp. METH4]|uniref:phage tail protein n=1 Tax=Massilia sp. METH4 TaxID=3123041 RepID=UPI0030CAD0E2